MFSESRFHHTIGEGLVKDSYCINMAILLICVNRYIFIVTPTELNFIVVYLSNKQLFF